MSSDALPLLAPPFWSRLSSAPPSPAPRRRARSRDRGQRRHRHGEIGRNGKALPPLVRAPIPPKNIVIDYPMNAQTKDALANPSSEGI
jgi:hypothetical protein